ncbi:hypothetical protein BJ742DRAFT_671381, partial [Cladochytrium replicatum]
MRSTTFQPQSRLHHTSQILSYLRLTRQPSFTVRKKAASEFPKSHIVVDYDHPGVNNAFLTKIGDPKAILYNDRSILENHHVASAFAILSREECNFVELLPRDIFRQFREQVIDMVLATDIANHFQTLSTFKNKVNASPVYDFQNHDDRALLWRAIMKASDVSNVSKSWEVYSVWLERITEEFYRQGDRERELGFPITPFMDR